MKYYSLLSLCLFYTTHIYCQSCGITEKEHINNMVLSKVWEQDTGGETRNRLTSQNPKLMDGETCYYFDSNDNLRKYISTWEYPESGFSIIGYYNTKGELMYVLFNMSQPEGYSCQGLAYKTYSDEFGDSITFNYNLQYVYSADYKNLHTQGYSNKYPSTIGEWNLSNYTHVDSLKLYSKIDVLQALPDSKKVKFFKPSKNQISFINGHEVNLKEQSNTSSKVIRTMNIGEKVTISNVLQEDLIENIGHYNWYKVKNNHTIGFVFGAFLEPVEKEVEK